MTLPCLARADRTGIPSFVLRLSFAHRRCPTSGRRTFTNRDESMRLGVNHLDRHRALPLITRLRLNLPPSLVVPPNSRYANYPGCFLSLSLSLSLIGESQGARSARKAMESRVADPLRESAVRAELSVFRGRRVADQEGTLGGEGSITSGGESQSIPRRERRTKRATAGERGSMAGTKKGCGRKERDGRERKSE